MDATRWLAMAVGVCACVWTAYLLAFWPALMTDDSVDQWRQLLAGQLTGQHPPFHTMLNWLATRVWLSPSAIAVAQILALALTFGLTVRELLHWHVPRPLLTLLTLVFAASPANGLMVVTLWKDIPYSIALLGFFTAMLRAVRTRGSWLRTPAGTLTMAGLGSLLSLLRHNGLFVVVLLFAGLLYAFPVQRRRVVVAALATLVAIFLVRGPLETALGVQPVSRYFVLANQTHQIAAMLVDGAELTPSQTALLTAVMPLEKWKDTYNCFTVIPTFSAGNASVVEGQVGNYVRVFRSLAVQHPISLLKRQICMSSLVWNLRSEAGSRFFVYYPGIVETPSSPKSDPWLPGLRDFLVRSVGRTLEAGLETFFWRPATYLYLTVFAVGLLAWRTGQRTLWVLLLPSAAQSLILVGLNVVQDFRYQYGVYMIGLVSLALPFARPGSIASASMTNDAKARPGSPGSKDRREA